MRTLNRPFVILLLVGGLSVLVSGCVSSNAGNVYSRADTRQAFAVKSGVIENIRSVRIEGTPGYVGTAAGAAVGGIAGRGVGGGTGQDIATVAGAVVGGIAGAAAEEAVTRRPGFEYIVQLDGGQSMAIVQEDGGEQFRVGDRVRILERAGQFRVVM